MRLAADKRSCAVIRHAIDVSLTPDRQRFSEVAEVLLASADSDDLPGEDWADIKSTLESDLIGHLG